MNTKRRATGTTFWLKVQWTLWISLVFVVLAGAIADDLSSAKQISFELHPGTSDELEVFRPLPHALDLALTFNRTNWSDKRPELGEFETKRGSTADSGFIEFVSPGTPIKLLVQHGDSKALYEALPAGAFNATTKERDFVPFIDDGNPHRFSWPPDHSLRLQLPSGYSTVRVSVLEVGAALVGEQAALTIHSPVTFKGAAPGYGFLWWFMFWPLYAAILTIYGAALLWILARQRTPDTKPGSVRQNEGQ